jgi:thiamine biosynthesis lipoprotein
MNHETFAHEAMATEFQIFVAGKPASYARQAAGAAFAELDRIEEDLSRYVESSDIARANRLAAGESTVIGEETLHCLLTALEVSAATGRAFDPAYASQPDPAAADAPLFALDPAGHTLTSLCPRLHLDLGAVGKGYALDRMADVLREWDVGSACLQSGGSTMLALDPPPGATGWVASLENASVTLAHRAISGSGTAVQGRHLIDPRTGRPAERLMRVWSFARGGAEADALSTAFFVMSDAEVARFCVAHPQCGAVLANVDGTLAWHGATG